MRLKYISHSGKGHDDNPPGRGSGRYPYGSGARPYQREKEIPRDQDTVLKKGSTVYRVDRRKDVDKDSNPDLPTQTYVSLLKSNAYNYLKYASSGEFGIATFYDKNNGNNGNPYMLELKINTDLVIPAYNKTIDAFINTVADKSIDQVAKDTGISSTDLEQFVKKYENKTIDEASKDVYRKFIGTFVRESDSRKKFIEILEKQGYNAIEDVWDTKDKENTGTATIIFDKNNTTVEKAIPVENKEILWLVDSIGYSVDEFPPPEKWKDWLSHSICRGVVIS